MANIHIKNLRLRCIIGANPWERNNKQDVVVNVYLDFDATNAIATDQLSDTVDYKTITKNIIHKVEQSEYMLLEKLCHNILVISMENPAVSEAKVVVDKPHALRFSDSVSITLSQRRDEPSHC